MRADGGDCRAAAGVGADDRDGLALEFDAQDATRRGQLGAFTNLDVAAGHGMLLSSSRSTVASNRSTSSGTWIRSITSAKNPRTIKRRARSAGIPRACR